jgi:cytoskeletal protein CcmA (bactofilin family)
MNLYRLAIPLVLAGACTIHVDDPGRDPRNPDSSNPPVEEPAQESFDRVENETDAKIVLVAEESWTNPDAKWEVSCTSSPLDILVAEVNDGVLTLTATDALLGADCAIKLRAEPLREILVSGNGDLDVDGTVRDLAYVEIRGDGEVTLGTVQTTNIELWAHGNGQIKIDNLQADTLNATVAGRGDMWLSGAVPEAEIHVQGLGDLIAEDLLLQDLHIELTGAGNPLVNVSGTISGKVSGDGNLDVFGNPDGDVEQTGAGHVIHH